MNFELLYWDVFIHIFAAVEGIEQDVCSADKHDYITESKTTQSICHHTLQRNEDTATADHGHKGSRSDRGVFAQALDCHVEYTAPHDGCA